LQAFLDLLESLKLTGKLESQKFGCTRTKPPENQKANALSHMMTPTLPSRLSIGLTEKNSRVV